MARISLLLSLLLVLTGCELMNGSAGPRAGVDQIDYASIEDPRERWEAHGLTDYTVRQTRICFCAGPREYVAVVRNNDVVELLEPEPDMDGQIFPEHFMTIDEIFDMLEATAKQNPVVFNVAYDSDYGYPTSIEIDVSEQIADEELTMTMAELQPLSRQGE